MDTLTALSYALDHLERSRIVVQEREQYAVATARKQKLDAAIYALRELRRELLDRVRAETLR